MNSETISAALIEEALYGKGANLSRKAEGRKPNLSLRENGEADAGNTPSSQRRRRHRLHAEKSFAAHPILHIVVWVEFILIAVPIVILLLSCIVPRWSLLAEGEFSLRGIEVLFEGGYDIWSVCGFSIALAMGVAVLSTFIATCTAWAVVHFNTRLRWIVEVLSFMPLLVPAVVFGMGINILFLSNGLGNSVFAVVVVQILCNVTFATKIMTDITEVAGDKLEQQARVLGANPITAFLNGVLPSLAPGIMSSIGLSFIGSNCQYFLTFLMSGGTVQTLATVVFPMVGKVDRMVSSTYAVLFVLVNAAFFLLFQAVSNKLVKRYGKNLGVQ